jgi:HAE1 family hydrophobic/amphiphilic exporter-1
MNLCGYSLDNLSLMALTLSVGFLIDDAIVFLENMVRRMEAGEPVWTAVFAGAKEISFTILAMTLSLGSVFIPLVGMAGMMGRVFREFGVTIIVAVVASGVVSLTLTPMMCSRLLKEYDKNARSWLERTAHAIEDKFLKVYSPTLTFALKHWYFSVIAYLACFFGVYAFYSMVPKSFLPIGDSGFIFGAWLTATDTSPHQMKEIQDGIVKAISTNDHVAGFVTVSGFSSRTNSNTGLTFIALDDPAVKPRPNPRGDEQNSRRHRRHPPARQPPNQRGGCQHHPGRLRVCPLRPGQDAGLFQRHGHDGRHAAAARPV